MATVASVLNEAARRCSINAPATWSTATSLEHVELRDDFLIETLENVRNRVDLPSPIGRQATITGDGSESYSLPSDFVRLKRDALGVYESTRLQRAGTPIGTDGLWTHINDLGSAGAFRYYRLEGYPGAYSIKFEADLTAGTSVTVSYMSDRIVYDGSGYSSTFDAETDVLLLPRRLVVAGIVYRFRDRRGLDFTADLSRYEVELSRLVTDSGNQRTVTFAPSSDEWLPMRTPTPDYIPDA